MDTLADLETRRTEAARTYPDVWAGMLSAWAAAPSQDNRAWLMYAANYIFQTGGVRWALDPVTLHHRLPPAPIVDSSPLAALDYVVLSHRHADHFDPNLLAELKDFPAHWVVPEALLEPLRTLNLPREKLLVARPLEPLSLGGLTLTPFPGLHWEPDPTHPNGLRGVDSTGYLAGFEGKRWLIPGDTRLYDASRLPDLGPVDGLFAHLWLGRGQALEACPPRLDEFGRFCLALQPRRIVLTHLDEWGRPARELWTERHARLAIDWFAVHAPGLPVEYAMMGNGIML